MLPDRYRAGLTNSLGTLEALARQPESTLKRPVPACPGWTLDALFGHLGSIERWATAVVRGGDPSRSFTTCAESGDLVPRWGA